MNKEEFTAKMLEITDNLTDQGKVTANLTELYNAFENVFDSNITLTSMNESLKNDNDELKKYNFDLFKQVGVQNNNLKKNDTSFNLPDDKEEEKLKYEDLFNEKGEFI